MEKPQYERLRPITFLSLNDDVLPQEHFQNCMGMLNRSNMEQILPQTARMGYSVGLLQR